MAIQTLIVVVLQKLKQKIRCQKKKGRNTGQCHEPRQFKQRTSFIPYTKSTNSIWRSIHILKVRRICGICDGVGESSVALQFFETLRTKIYLMFLISYICKSAIKKQSIFSWTWLIQFSNVLRGDLERAKSQIFDKREQVSSESWSLFVLRNLVSLMMLFSSIPTDDILYKYKVKYYYSLKNYRTLKNLVYGRSERVKLLGIKILQWRDSFGRPTHP